MSLARPHTGDEQARSLQGKTCLVTGGSRGIGRVIAIELARHGADVAVNYRNSIRKAGAVADTIERIGENAVAVESDVAEMETVERMVEEVHGALGTIDVLVNNAGITADRRFSDMTREEWDRVIDVNLGGAFNCSKACYEDVRDSPDGRIINISSVVAQRGNYGQANYAASKSGLFGLTRSLALELAGSGATANCVAPGFTATDMLSTVPDGVRDRIRERIPMNRFAQPEEVVGSVRFLAAPESSYVTGQVIGVNGGMVQ